MLELHVTGKSPDACDVSLSSPALIWTKDVLAAYPVTPVLREH
jgi:hypothetical protein